MKDYEYPCGCSFSRDDEHIKFDPTSKINLGCKRTWDLISDGNTKGCFQLESRLGRTMSKKLKPSNIEELSALISIMRPGCLEAFRDGKSVSNHYIDKKNGNESVDYFHPALEPILSNTYGEMVYQEQAMEIAKTIAGFDLQEADMLRKAIGKKKPEEMAKIKTTFIKGAKKQKIVDETQAEEIFNWIEKSQRYSFNKSHAISYAINAYLSAYAKAHFPRIFFCSYLKFAKDKIDPQAEIKELIQNANEMNIEVYPPDFRLLNEFFIMKDGRIYFGLTDIKGVGNSVYQKILSIIENNKDIDLNNWYAIVYNVLLKINITAAKALISCGAFDYLKYSRNKMLFELQIFSELTKKELELLRVCSSDNIKNILLFLCQQKLTSKRKESVFGLIKSAENPPYSLQDSIEWLSDSEYNLLGYSITCSKIDMYDISMTNSNCRDFKNGINTNNIMIPGEIENINVVKTKNGKNPGAEMSFLTLIDSTGSIDSVIVFPEQYQTYKNVLYNGNVIIVKGNRSKNRDGLIVEKIYLPSS
jgi:DNA polymerase III subunit alpha